jgi:Fe-S cluster biogenesis protein NfuA
MSAVDIQPVGTPNPRSVKFLTDRTLLPTGSADIRDPESARKSPLAMQLLNLDEVEGVFICQNFITVTAKSDDGWNQLSPVIVQQLRDFFESGEEVLVGELDSHGGGAGDVERRIKDILDQQIRPAVAMDGGDIIFMNYSNGVVQLRMSGACGGCPSSTATLKAGIETRLRHFIPEVLSVEAI